MQHNIFAGLDLWVVLYAAAMALVASLLTTSRMRNAQRLRGLPLSSWWTTLPDTGAGAFVGTLAAVAVPKFVPAFDNFTGVSLLAAGGGILGPKFWDLVSSDNALKSILVALAQAATGPLGKLVASAAAQQQPKKDGDTDGSNQAPPTP